MGTGRSASSAPATRSSVNESQLMTERQGNLYSPHTEQRVIATIDAFISAGMVASIQYNTHCTVLYCTVLYCTVLYCTVLYCTVL